VLVAPAGGGLHVPAAYAGAAASVDGDSLVAADDGDDDDAPQYRV
jgi:hypothetical protein